MASSTSIMQCGSKILLRGSILKRISRNNGSIYSYDYLKLSRWTCYIARKEGLAKQRLNQFKPMPRKSEQAVLLTLQSTPVKTMAKMEDLKAFYYIHLPDGTVVRVPY